MMMFRAKLFDVDARKVWMRLIHDAHERRQLKDVW